MKQLRIKRREYLLFALDYYNRYVKETEDVLARRRNGESVPNVKKKTPEQLRKEFEHNTGLSVFVL